MSDEPMAVSLVVKTSGSAEIFLSDSQRQLVASGVEHLVTRQLPGVYKLRIRQGRTSSEQLVLLEEDTELEIQAPEFASPMPLAGTRKSHAFHSDAAVECSQQIHWHLGTAVNDTTIFLQSRYWTGATPEASIQRSFAPPATGLSLRRFDGGERVDLTTVAQAGAGPGWDPSAACTVAVAPGSYILSARTASGAIIEQAIQAAPGWQTQVFILRQPLQAERRRRESDTATDSPTSEGLFSLAITMSRGSYHVSNQNHLSELARIALADERPLVSDELRMLLGMKFDNPMLGIFGAHLLLLADAESKRPAQRLRRGANASLEEQNQATFDPGLFDHVVGVLREFLGTTHPDVEALSLRMSQPAQRTAVAIETPPMLRSSWSLLVEGSQQKPFLIPVELWKRIARMVPSRPFLGWFADEAGNSLDADLTRELKSRLRVNAPTSALAQPRVGIATRSVPLETLAVPSAEAVRTFAVARDLDVPASAVDWLMNRSDEEP